MPFADLDQLLVAREVRANRWQQEWGMQYTVTVNSDCWRNRIENQAVIDPSESSVRPKTLN